MPDVPPWEFGKVRLGPSPMWSALLSAMVPGLGHLGRSPRRSVLLLAASTAFVAVSVWYAVSTPRTRLVAYAADPDVSVAVIVGSVALLLLRSAAGLDAYLKAPPGPARGVLRRTLGIITAAALFASVVLLPHAVVARHAAAQMGLLHKVFPQHEPPVAMPTPESLSSRSASTKSDYPAPVADSSADVFPSTADVYSPGVGVPPVTDAPAMAAPQLRSASDAVPPEPVDDSPASWDGRDRLTVALLGSDAGFDRAGVRTDAIALVTVEVSTGRAAMFSIPRNWRRLRFPEGTRAAHRWPDGYPGIANEVYQLGLWHPGLFPEATDPAGHSIKSALAQLTGLPVQYYVLLDMRGFVKAVDILGGVRMYVPNPVQDSLKPLVGDGDSVVIDVKPGFRELSGAEALAYVRSRRQSSDYSRMSRQRCLVGAVLDQTSPTTVLAVWPALAEVISSHVKTDVPLGRLEELLEVMARVVPPEVVSVNFIPPEFPRGDAPTDKVREAVRAALSPETEASPPSVVEACAPQGG